MRDVPYTQALAPTREIGARLTFTDPRLRFQYVPTSEAPSDFNLYDACEYGTGILQAAVLKSDPAGTIRFRYIADLNGVWPAWSTVQPSTDPVYHLALHAGRLFMSSTNPSFGFWRGDYAGGVFTGGTSISRYDHSLLAPISTNDLYVLKHNTAAGKPYSYGKLLNVNMTTWGETAWYGRIYDTIPARYMDAVRAGNVDYIYTTEEAGGRTIFIKNEAGAWSEKRFVIPLDVVDDVSSFRLSSANVINGKVLVTGALSRSWGVPMHIYTFGPDRYTLGRDLFIGSQHIEGSGKLHLIGSTLWYIGAGLTYKAPATALVGYSNPALSFQTEAAADIRLSTASNQPYSLTLTLKHDISHLSIRPGSMMELEVRVNGEYSDIGTFSVDAVVSQNDDSGTQLTLALRSWALKELASWESDAPYDYWSQTKLSTNPKDMAQVIRTTGQWKEESGALTTYDLNTNGFLYTSAQACHNTTTRAKVTRKSGDWNVRFGVGVNYYIETKAEAALRTGKSTTDIKEADYGQNGLFAIFGKKEYNDFGPGVGLYLLNNSVWTQLTSESLTLIEDTEMQAQIRFLDGLVQVHTRTTGTWSKVLEYTIESNDLLPWKAGSLGRGAIYTRNETGSATFRKIINNLIAVDDNASFLTSDKVVIDNEIIAYSGKSGPVPTTIPEVPEYPTHKPPGNITYDYPESAFYRSFKWGTIGNGPEANLIASGQAFGIAGTAKIRQKLNNTIYYPGKVSSVSVSLYKVGNPTDDVKVTITNSLLASKTAYTIPSAQIDPYPADIRDRDSRKYTSFPTDVFTMAATDYAVFERTGALDASNYYKLLAYPYTAGATASACDKYNEATKVWTAVTGIVVEVRPAGCTSGKLCLTSEWTSAVGPGTFDNLVLRGLPIRNHYSTQVGYYLSGVDLPEIWTSALPFVPGGSMYEFPISVPVPTQMCRPWNIYPTLLITQRGTDGTALVDHAEGTPLYCFRGGPFIYISQVEYFSSEYDLTLEDMTAEICAKAGVQTVESFLAYPASVTPSASNPNFSRRNVIAHLRLDSLDGSVILEACKPTAVTAGISLTIDGSTLSVGSESFDTGQTITGNVSISFFEQENFVAGVVTGHFTVISVWQNGTYLHSFTASDVGSGEFFTIKGTATVPIGVHLSEACMRVDNWILDNGKKGAQLIEELIGEKRFYYQDHAGAVRLFRTREEVNAASPYTLAVIEGGAESDANIATRIRIEGSDINEVFDEEMLIEHGNLFKLVHMNEVNSPADAAFYAGVVMDELGSRYKNQTLQGAADPRVEPNDIIYARLPDGSSTRTVKVIVDGLDFVLSMDENNAAFDMSISGRIPRSDL
jgi:hypothetical protein